MPVTTYTIVDGELLSENRNGTERLYLPDAQGNTVALLDTSGAIAKSYAYWSYGSVESGDTAATKYLYGGTYGVRRQANGDNYVRFRVQDPVDGKWLTVDPVWPHEFAYAFCRLSPATLVDLLGLVGSRSTCQQSPPPTPGLDPPRQPFPVPYKDCFSCLVGSCANKEGSALADCMLSAAFKACQQLCGTSIPEKGGCFAFEAAKCAIKCSNAGKYDIDCLRCLSQAASKCEIGGINLGPIKIGPGAGLVPPGDPGGTGLCITSGKWSCCVLPNGTVQCFYSEKPKPIKPPKQPGQHPLVPIG